MRINPGFGLCAQQQVPGIVAAMRFVIAALLAVSTMSGCTTDESKSANSGDCADIWQVGKPLSNDYDGCTSGSTTASLTCDDGRKLFAQGENLYAFSGALVSEGGWDKAVAQCQKPQAPPKPKPTPTPTPTPTPLPPDPDTLTEQPTGPSEQCTTKAEFDQARTGMTRAEVENIFGNTESFDGGGGQRVYVSCDMGHAAIMNFSGGTLVSMEWTIAS